MSFFLILKSCNLYQPINQSLFSFYLESFPLEKVFFSSQISLRKTYRELDLLCSNLLRSSEKFTRCRGGNLKATIFTLLFDVSHSKVFDLYPVEVNLSVA